MTANFDEQERKTATKAHGKASERDDGVACFESAIDWMRLSEWEKARADLKSAIERGVDVAALFVDAYGDAGEFEEAVGVELPGDIADIVDPISEEEDAALVKHMEEGLASEKREKLRAAAGGWVGLHDPEELKRMLYQARIDGSREPPAP